MEDAHLVIEAADNEPAHAELFPDDLHRVIHCMWLCVILADHPAFLAPSIMSTAGHEMRRKARTMNRAYLCAASNAASNVSPPTLSQNLPTHHSS